ncbi:MAG: SAM-dependent methyltransferase [Nitrospirae bacterium]|nr:SAM-dependent methyltransferase [Nitrospirota bacterium]
MISGNRSLIQKITAKISREGPISFKTFMEMALYEPEEGYYSSPGEPFGAGGDFYTSPDVHPLFSQMVGRQLAQMAGILQDSSRFDLVEGGPGNGQMASQLLRTLQKNEPELFHRLTYYMVERSPALIERQKALFLSAPEFYQKIRWAGSLKELPPIEGCIFSNELMDAFPVHRVVWKDGKLLEIHVDFKAKQLAVPVRSAGFGGIGGVHEVNPHGSLNMTDGQFVEILFPLSPEIELYFKAFPVNRVDGQEAEVNLNALSWLKEAGRKLKKGFVLTIDYGYLADEIHSIKRKKGTLLCYRNHQAGTDPYQWIGEQDMTAHINFSALHQAGLEENLLPLGLADQAQFLIGLGILGEMERHLRTVGDPPGDPEFRAMKHLIHPEGLGAVFKVFIQQKGVGTAALDGLKFSIKSSFP